MICVPHAPAQMCTQRRLALRSGEMFYHYHPKAWGWVFPADRWRPGGDVLLWTHCPFCGGALPASNVESLWQRIKRALDEGEGAE